MENAKQEIAKLVEKYDRLKTENRLRDLNEAQTINGIDPRASSGLHFRGKPRGIN